jgi:predicted small secreted protein
VQFGALAACSLVIAACGNTADTNGTGASVQSSTTSSAAPPRPVVSPAQLDVGKYPTAPRPPLGVSGNPVAGAVTDAQHLADFVLGPWEVDDKLVGTYLNSYYVIGTADVLQQLGPESLATAAGQHGLINGFASARQEPDKTAMVNAVLRFADPAAAIAASKAMGDAATKLSIKGITPTALPIPGHPDAVASTYPFTPHGSDQARATVRSFTPHGPYVLMQFVQSIDGLERATALVTKSIDAQGPLVDQFTPAANLAAVPLDPTGLLARVLPTAEEVTAKNAVYAARGAEHFQSNPISSATLFKDTGTTEVGMGSTNVYQTKDEGSALMVTNAFNHEISSEGMKTADTVAALPESHCYTLPKAFYCVAPAGRYAIEARSPQLADVHQQLSAQYVMLTAK